MRIGRPGEEAVGCGNAAFQGSALVQVLHQDGDKVSHVEYQVFAIH
jgi:hypothetical protein